MKSRAAYLGLPCLLSLSAAVACGGDPEVSGDGDLGSDGGSGGTPSNTGGTVNVGGTDGGGSSGSAGTGGTSTAHCGGVQCGLGQRCETDDNGDKSCVDNECSDLDCASTEECQPASGGGNYCADISCNGDVDCPINRFCDGEVCVDDACEGGTAQCDGDGNVILCSPNGGEEAQAPYECGSAGYYESSCDDSTPGAAGCTCEDDWDCPEFTTCEVGVCVGTGVEPTCTLEPEPFENLLPELEFHWGGESNTAQDATGKAFPWSAQVASTPIVINLDDDNGDGKVNELDFPEILFMTYHGDSPGGNGVVRAVHGGGPDKGQDYFALCGDKHWEEGDPVATDCGDAGGEDDRDNALARSAGALAAGDLDYDGYPEIVVPLETGGIQILDNRGAIISAYDGDWPTGNNWKYPAPAIANIDFEGFAEIVVGNHVLTLKKEADKLVVDRVFQGDKRTGTQDQNGNEEQHHGPMVCLADLTSDHAGLEIVAGSTAYRLPAPVDCGADPTSAYCEGRLEVVWDAFDVDAPKADPDLQDDHADGFCAIADVLGDDTAAAPGPGNEPDGKPEVIVIAEGHLLILEGENGNLVRYEDLGGGNGGGAPNVDDFDGDGFPEIATALADFYTVIDLQEPHPTNCAAWPDVMGKSDAPPSDPDNPARTPGGGSNGACDSDDDCNDGAVCNEQVGTCVCLHSGWKRGSEDDSSRASASSVFDFNGDGAAEVIYNDECYFRIYEGGTGRLYLQMPSLSRTINENPVVADVDNDGNAEIIFLNNNETLQCSEASLDGWDPNDDDLTDNDDVDRATLPNGIDVWGDPSDQWVAARRIWNQGSYHVTNVTEGGSIPLHEPESWKPLNGRLYNTYRSQPRNYNVAPDLALTAIQISSPDVACGSLSDTIQIVVEVRNQGDLRVGPGVVLEYEGVWEDPALEEALEDDMGDPLTFVLDKSLEPGGSTLVTVEYEAGRNGRDDLPVSINVSIDGDGAERECNEDNNGITGDVEAGAEIADLRLEIDGASGCAMPEVELTVFNDGSLDAENVLVYLYAGDPSQGGTLLGETTIDGPIAPGDSETVTVDLDPIGLDVTIWGVADPMDEIAECNDANNVAEGPFLDCNPDVK